MEQQQDTKTFVNPVKLSYVGSYVIELTENTPTEGFIPDTITIEDNKIVVHTGSIKEEGHGIDFYSDGKHFCLGYKIKNIRKTTGELIWVNNNYR